MCPKYFTQVSLVTNSMSGDTSHRGISLTTAFHMLTKVCNLVKTQSACLGSSLSEGIQLLGLLCLWRCFICVLVILFITFCFPVVISNQPILKGMSSSTTEVKK